MGLKLDLENSIDNIFKSQWTTRDGTVVPEPSDIQLGNHAVKLKAAVLYADLSDSTSMVNNMKKEFSAEIYKAFLHCAAKVIKFEGGVITSYDGDRIMAVFIGNSKCTSAARAALKINWATKNIVQPRIKNKWKTDYIVKHTVGIDISDLFIARTGVRGANDLVWVGRAANYAAKLSDLSDQTPTWITSDVYDQLADGAKFSNGVNMWSKKTWTSQNDLEVYCSTYWWAIS